MQTFTALTTPLETVEQALPHKYPMELNRADMLALVYALGCVAALPDPLRPELCERAGSLRSGILETLGIEEI